MVWSDARQLYTVRFLLVGYLLRIIYLLVLYRLLLLFLKNQNLRGSLFSETISCDQKKFKKYIFECQISLTLTTVSESGVVCDFFVYICRKHTARIWLPKHSWYSTWCVGKKIQSLSQPASFARTDHTHWSAILDSHGLASLQQKLLSLSSQESGCHTCLLCLTRSASCNGMAWCLMNLSKR